MVLKSIAASTPAALLVTIDFPENQPTTLLHGAPQPVLRSS
ncbi:hypothetical protein AAur_3805 [Paenarthrobacter aurescens TC1]|uniref:Uncharacterized protein n=1 Tax=Paenarthrobacter aurescens (strain TC1) TaxID=290340 RepID=A1RB73_PAEAT|nr:hypothetical protein AAur_3805 [Paenarthrobacter aurescens TC1]